MVDQHVIFLNGIPSSGKSSVAQRLHQKLSGFRVLTGDEIVRRVPFSQRAARSKELFNLTLDAIEDWLATTDVIVDGAWTEAQVREAQDRFGEVGLFVVLRIDEQERQRRDAKRRDRKLAYWDTAWHMMPGPDDLYDVVIDSKATSVDGCAELIVAEARERWD